jgi:F-type H+-transporting ATPase subunit epsilon
MRFDLLTLSGVKFSGDVLQVSLTTVEGQVGILPDHEPMTAVAVGGAVTVRTKAKTEVFATYGGLLEVTAQHVRLLADEAEHEDELVASEIEVALRRAEEHKANAKDKVELARAQQMVDRQAVRLGVARMRRRR